MCLRAVRWTSGADRTGHGGADGAPVHQERQREGIKRAKASGAYRDGRPRLDHDRIRQLHEEGASPTAIAKAIGCSRMQVYRVLAAWELTCPQGDIAMTPQAPDCVPQR